MHKSEIAFAEKPGFWIIFYVFTQIKKYWIYWNWNRTNVWFYCPKAPKNFPNENRGSNYIMDYIDSTLSAEIQG